jgi:hypothetical protein
MTTPRRLLFIEVPPPATDINTWLFRDLGFEIRQRPLLPWTKILHLEADGIRLAEFDVIALCDGVASEASSLSQELFDGFKQQVTLAEKASSRQIQIVGRRLNVSGEAQPKFNEMYRGLFFGQDTTRAQAQTIVETLLGEALADEQHQCLKRYFPD